MRVTILGAALRRWGLERWHRSREQAASLLLLSLQRIWLFELRVAWGEGRKERPCSALRNWLPHCLSMSKVDLKGVVKQAHVHNTTRLTLQSLTSGTAWTA